MKNKKINKIYLFVTFVFLLFIPNIVYGQEIQIPKAVLNANYEYQEIDGFGVSQSADIYSDQLYNHNKREEIMDLLFSKDDGIGLSILRSEVGSGLNMPTIHPDKDTWDYTPYIPEQWVLNGAKNRGVETFMSTVWSPPAWMKTNNRIVRGGSLKKEYYQEYADYLANYIKGYRDNHNIEIDAISIANEPEYSAPWQSCLWSGEEFKIFVRDYLKPTFLKENLDTKIIVGEEGSFTDKRLYQIYEDEKALDSVDIVASHYYRGNPYVFERAKNAGKKIWITETSETILSQTGFKDGVKWSRHIHDFLTKADVNSFIYRLGAAYKDNNESLIRLLDQDNYLDAKRLYSMGNFSKYIRPGFKRIEVTENPTGNLHMSAYKDDDSGDFVIVCVNDGQNNETFDLEFEGITVNSITPHLTNDKYNLADFDKIGVEDNKIRLSVSGYTTITYTGNINDEKVYENEDYRLIDNLDNWNEIYSRSDNWSLDSNNPYNAFDHDYSRAIRNRNSKEEIVYKLDSIKGFEAKIYYFKNLEGLNFEVSNDGENWQSIDYSYDLPRLTGGYREVINVYSTNMPESINYLKIIFDGGNTGRDKNLSSVKIY
ncbi:MAG: glycoside hydrolase [Peptoniphilaceae bacterium]|nr:glycoside hydrolase [Peptoniphilaceae bacterium]